MADREAYVAALDARAEQLTRRGIGNPDDAAVDHQRRLVERVDERPLTWAEITHGCRCSGLIEVSHVRKNRGPLVH